MLNANLSYQWLGPGILVSMAMAFTFLFVHDRTRVAAKYLAGAYLLVALCFVQVLMAGGDLRQTSLLLTLGSLFGGFFLMLMGISSLYERRFPWPAFWLPAVLASGVIVTTLGDPAYFGMKMLAVHGFMAVIHIVCGFITWRRARHQIDIAIAAIFLVQAVMVFLQVGQLYMPGASPLVVASYGKSDFAVTLRTINALFGIALGICLFLRFGVAEVERLRQLAGTDPLTGLLNRRAFEAEAAALRSSVAPLPTGLIICDIDHFKRVNDTHGHEAGDRALTAFAHVLVQQMPETAICTRLGGEEFCILIAGIDGKMTRLLATRLRMAVERLQVPTRDGPLTMTASFGCGEVGAGEDLRAAMAAVDTAVYQAKNDGRNLVREATAGAENARQAELPDHFLRAR